MKPKLKGNLAELYAAKTTMRRNMKTGQYVEFIGRHEYSIERNADGTTANLQGARHTTPLHVQHQPRRGLLLLHNVGVCKGELLRWYCLPLRQRDKEIPQRNLRKANRSLTPKTSRQ